MDWWNQRRCQNKAGIDSAAAAPQHRCVWVSCSLRHRLIWAGRRQTNNGTATPRVLFRYASPFQCHFLVQRQYKQNPRAKTHLTSSDPLDGSSPADLLKKKRPTTKWANETFLSFVSLHDRDVPDEIQKITPYCFPQNCVLIFFASIIPGRHFWSHQLSQLHWNEIEKYSHQKEELVFFPSEFRFHFIPLSFSNTRILES